MTSVSAAKPKPAGKPIWPKIPAAFVRAVLAGHSALGLAFAALIYLVCFSGTVAVFAREFQRWEQATAPVVTSVDPAAVQRMAEAAVARYPAGAELEAVYLYPPTPDLPRLSVSLDGKGGERAYVADREGVLVSEGDPAWTHFMLALHTDLHLPATWGRFLVGLTGVALLSSLISGLLAHPRVFKDSFHLRWGGSKRLQEADLHNRLGVWGLPFHVIISLTGALLGLTTVIVGVLALAVFKGDVNKAYDLFLPPQPQEDSRPAPLPDIASALVAAKRLSPESAPSYVAVLHPRERGQGVLINATVPNRLASSDSFTFDGQGKLVSSTVGGGATLGEKILASLGTLHFGWFGDLPIKIAYGVLGAAITVVTASGVAIWLARRRDKGRPAPRWERIWIATVWSQPLGYALSAIVGLVTASETAPLIAWIAVTLATVGLALPALASWQALSKALRLASAGALALVVVTHLALKAAATTDVAGFAVDAVLAVLAVALAWTVAAKSARNTPKVEQAI